MIVFISLLSFLSFILGTVSFSIMGKSSVLFFQNSEFVLAPEVRIHEHLSLSFNSLCSAILKLCGKKSEVRTNNKQNAAISVFLHHLQHEVHTKFNVVRTNFIWSSYEQHLNSAWIAMKFPRTTPDVRANFNWSSRERQLKFVRTTGEIRTNFRWNSYELHVKFVRTSCVGTVERTSARFADTDFSIDYVVPILSIHFTNSQNITLNDSFAWSLWFLSRSIYITTAAMVYVRGHAAVVS